MNTESGKVSRIEVGGVLDSMADALSRRVNVSNRKQLHRMCTDMAQTSEGLVVLYETGKYDRMISFLLLIFKNIWSKKYSFTYTETSVNMNNDENNECVPLFNSVFCDGLN